MKKIWIALVAGCLVAPAFPASASKPIVRYECFGKTARLTKPDRRGVVRGTNRADVLIVLGRNAVVLGRGGSDRICTGRGDDFVSGGDGHDRLRAGRGQDLLRGGGGLDYLNGEGGNDRLEGSAGTSATLVGGHGDDELFGGDDSNRDYIFGGRGADHLVGGNGVADNDLLVGGEATDVIEGGDGSFDTASFVFSDVPVHVDLAARTSSEDVLTEIEWLEGSVFDDRLVGDEMNNRISADDGRDVVMGAGGVDYISGGTGQDSLDGGEGADFLSFLGTPRGVTVHLEEGSAEGETTEAFTSFEHVVGTVYDDHLSGDSGPNELYGVRGRDVLLGGEGDDRLDSATSGDAGAGYDSCWDSGAVTNCEGQIHGDPRAYSTITGPTDAMTIAIPKFKEITGTASAGAFGPEPERVQIALRKFTGSGCYWWDARHSVMQPGHCERPLWVDADLDDGQGTWSRRVPAPVQLLSSGRYQVRSRIHQPGYSEEHFSHGNQVEFRLQ